MLLARLVKCAHQQVRLTRLLTDLLNSPVSILKSLDDFIQVDSLQNLQLSGHLFKMVKSLHLGGLELDEFVLLNLLQFEFVFEPLNYFVLHGHLVLYFLELLLQNFLALL